MEGIDTSVSEQLDTILEYLEGISGSLENSIIPALESILEAVQGINDYTEILNQILEAIQAITIPQPTPGDSIIYDIYPYIAEIGYGDKWEFDSGDVVYLFFEGTGAPYYVKAEYDGEAWTATEMCGHDVAEDGIGLSEGDSGEMVAIWVPGNDLSIAAGDDDYMFEDANIPWFLVAYNDFEVTDGTVVCEFTMNLPDGFVMLRVGDPNPGEYATLAEAHLTPKSLHGLYSDLDLILFTDGDDLIGIPYVNDNQEFGYHFFGLLDENVRGVPTAYSFILTKYGDSVKRFKLEYGNTQTADTSQTYYENDETGRMIYLPDLGEDWIDITE